MLASSAPDVGAALQAFTGPEGCVVDRKLDGVRLQVHRVGADVTIYTRSLDDITERLPEVVEAAVGAGRVAVVLDGEALGWSRTGGPDPSRRRRPAAGSADGSARTTDPLTCAFFDLLHLDGRRPRRRPLTESARRARPRGAPRAGRGASRHLRTGRGRAGRGGRGFFEATLAAGHEGVVVKSPRRRTPRGAGAAPGSRSSRVTRSTWSSSRWSGAAAAARGRPSNLHLGARGPDESGRCWGRRSRG